MRVYIESTDEARIFRNQLAAISYYLGPTVEIEAVMPDGSILRKPIGGSSLAAKCASLNERIEAKLQSLGVR